MKLPGFSFVSIEFVIVVLTVKFGVMRALYDSFTEEGWTLSAFPLLPVIDLLRIGLIRLRQHDRRTRRAIGFLMVGSASSLVAFTVLRQGSPGFSRGEELPPRSSSWYLVNNTLMWSTT